jgi:large subunit ribosomal protein L11
MAKKLEKQFKIVAPGGKATPAPPLGPALGANGINPGQFITAFNERTKELNGKIVRLRTEEFARLGVAQGCRRT